MRYRRCRVGAQGRLQAVREMRVCSRGLRRFRGMKIVRVAPAQPGSKSMRRSSPRDLYARYKERKSGRGPGRHPKSKLLAREIRECAEGQGRAAKSLQVAPAQPGSKSMRRSSPRDPYARYVLGRPRALRRLLAREIAECAAEARSIPGGKSSGHLQPGSKSMRRALGTHVRYRR